MNRSSWYPGLMAKTFRELQANLSVADLALELIDARLPVSSRSPRLAALLRQKRHAVVLNKADLADEELTLAWQSYFRQQGSPAIAVDGRHRQSGRYLLHFLDGILRQKRLRFRRPWRLVIAGIPNVGKSSLINAVTGKGAARTGNRPGVTVGRQWIRIHRRFDLLDTPGLLMPNFNRQTGIALAAVGGISEAAYDSEEVALWLLAQLQRLAKGGVPALEARYGVPAGGVPPGALLETVGRARGCLEAGGRVDRQRAAGMVIAEFRAGLLGRYTLELPPEER